MTHLDIRYDHARDRFLVENSEKTKVINLDGKPLLITHPEALLETDTNYVYYIVEEYHRGWDRWYGLADGWTYDLPNHVGDREMDACGACWQATGHFGTFSKDYAVNLCKDLKNMLIDIRVYKKYPSEEVKKHILACDITDFRVCECHDIFRKNVIV